MTDTDEIDLVSGKLAADLILRLTEERDHWRKRAGEMEIERNRTLARLREWEDLVLPDCQCLTCLDERGDMRILGGPCRVCDSTRCPRLADHRLRCSVERERSA